MYRESWHGSAQPLVSTSAIHALLRQMNWVIYWGRQLSVWVGKIVSIDIVASVPPRAVNLVYWPLGQKEDKGCHSLQSVALCVRTWWIICSTVLLNRIEKLWLFVASQINSLLRKSEYLHRSYSYNSSHITVSFKTNHFYMLLTKSAF